MDCLNTGYRGSNHTLVIIAYYLTLTRSILVKICIEYNIQFMPPQSRKAVHNLSYALLNSLFHLFRVPDGSHVGVYYSTWHTYVFSKKIVFMNNLTTGWSELKIHFNKGWKVTKNNTLSCQIPYILRLKMSIFKMPKN